MGGDPQYNYPAQPSYGEGMADAMKAQMQQLLGQGDYADIYKEAGFEGGNLGDILTGVEAPIRKQTAQIDTDVLRQTILGEEQKVVKDPETGKYGIPGAEIVTSEQVGNAPTQSAGGSYHLIGSETGGISIFNTNTGGTMSHAEELKELERQGLIESQGKMSLVGEGTPVREYYKLTSKGKKAGLPTINYNGVEWFGDPNLVITNDRGQSYKAGLFSPEKPNAGLTGKLKGTVFEGFSSNLAAAAADQGVPEAEVKLEFEFTNPNTGKPLQEGEVVREGTGMVDLLGDTRQLEGQDRQAGFDESGQFLGLSALAEDIGRAGQQRAREADIADVERLGGRATDAYRAQGDLGGALETARAMGAGGSEGMSAIPSDPLFSGTATGNLADRARAENLGISAISGGRMGDYDPLALAPAPVEDFRASIEPSAPMVEYQPPRSPTPSVPAPRSTDAAQTAGGFQGSVQPGQPALGTPATAQPQQAQYAQPGGTDAFRSALMQQGMGALDQGLTARESRAIQEAARARATNMGRTFDQTASIKEAEDVIREDNARRMQNRAFAQSALGQEVGIQQADLARGLQAQQLEMARQTAGADRQLTAEEKDIERAMRRGAMEEQFRQSGLGAERASAAQMVGLEQATSADPFQAILQRQGQNNLGAGGQLFGQAGYGLQSGPQYLNPEAGLGFISNQATNAANMFNAQQAAGATRQAGLFGGLGSMAGGFLGNTGLFT
jgi:hypothetical protein